MAGRGVIYLVEGDDGRKVTVTWEGKDLTGWSAVCHAKQPNGQILTKTGTLTSGGPPGIFEFAFATTDLVPDNELLRAIEFEFTDPGGEITTIPSRPNSLFVLVRRHLA